MIAYGGRELAKAFRTVRKNTIQIAEEIPEDKYDAPLVPGMRTVSQLLRHIAFIPMLQEEMQQEKRIKSTKEMDFGASIRRASAKESEARSKAQIIQLLTDEGERVARWLESLPTEFLAETYTDNTGANPRTRFEGLLSIKEQEMHHRGQLMVMQRLLGLVPHLTRQREEMARARQAAAKAAN